MADKSWYDKKLNFRLETMNIIVGLSQLGNNAWFAHVDISQIYNVI